MTEADELRILRSEVKAQAEYIKCLRDKLDAATRLNVRYYSELRDLMRQLHAWMNGATDVVRCSECIFAHPRVDGLMQCDITKLVNHENFYCANGARREVDE